MLIIGKEAEKDIREAYDWYERKLKSNLKGTRKKRVTVRSSLNYYTLCSCSSINATCIMQTFPVCSLLHGNKN
jgi:hypothetical protein